MAQFHIGEAITFTNATQSNQTKLWLAGPMRIDLLGPGIGGCTQPHGSSEAERDRQIKKFS
eukprot:1371641-Amorphochlora_amoeboformis.AAC.1